MNIHHIIYKKYILFAEGLNSPAKFYSFESLISNSLIENNPYFKEKKYWKSIIEEALNSDINICEYISQDISTIMIRDPACQNIYEAIYFYKGFHAVSWYRISNYYWKINNKILARRINHFVNCSLGIDIHPGATIGHSIFIDHGTGVVIGETAILENYISMFHGVTLGGTGKECNGARHPYISSHVLLSSHCSIIGNIKIDTGVKIAASSVVLESMPKFVTVAGIPAKIVKCSSPLNNDYQWDFQLNE